MVLWFSLIFATFVALVDSCADQLDGGKEKTLHSHTPYLHGFSTKIITQMSECPAKIDISCGKGRTLFSALHTHNYATHVHTHMHTHTHAHTLFSIIIHLLIL